MLNDRLNNTGVVVITVREKAVSSLVKCFDLIVMISKVLGSMSFFRFFSTWIFLSRIFTNCRTAGEVGISITPLYHFHLLQGYLDIS